MNDPGFVNQPVHLDESQLASGYSAVLSQVANLQRPVIVQRDGVDLAAVVPVEYLDMIRDAVARQQAESLALKIDWDAVIHGSLPSQEWFDNDDPKPF